MSDCIEWQGYRNSFNYGKTAHKGKYVFAHRLALAEYEGIEIPDASVKCLHSCDNPPCVNPEHLRWGTQAENAKDMSDRGRCRNGGRYKVSDEDIEIAIALRLNGASYRVIGEQLGITKKHAWNLLQKTGD